MIYSNDCWIKDTCPMHNEKCHDDEDSFCIKLFKLDALYKNSLLSEDQRKNVPLYVEDVDEESYRKLNDIKNSVVDFVRNGSNLYIYSNICGNGKSEWAIKLMQNYFGKIWASSGLNCKGLFINVPRFFLSLKDSISNKSEYVNHIKMNVSNADLVVWDDIATKTITDFESEHLLSIIDSRINERKSNIFTSNVNGEDLYSLIGPRLASRVMNFSEVIELRGKDKRTYRGGVV